MRMRCFLVLSLLCVPFLGTSSVAQSQQSADARKVIHQTAPTYPEMAKRLQLAGTVRVVATVAPDGTVKKVEPMGGNPVLIEASRQAVINWKYAPASSETKETVELHFNPLSQ